ncbi:MAG: hypothetical protein HYV16_06300 [Gammaproteobacteria bacterium]|nr:hypothetical protein [Gammaproteobacteria bacterium]
MHPVPRLPGLILPLSLSLLSACSSGGGGGDDAAPPVPVAPAVIKSFGASPDTVDAGAGATLSWTVEQAQACTLNGQAVNAAAGSQDTGPLQSTTEYALSCSGAGGTVNRRATVTVRTSPPPSAVDITQFRAEPAEVAAGGASVLSWRVANATACSLNDDSVDAVQGAKNTGALQAATRYTLACRNVTSQQSRELEVKVTAAPPPPSAGWRRLADMPAGIAKFGVGALGGKLYLVGGYNTSQATWIYDIASDSWRAGPYLIYGTDNVSVATRGDMLYAVGGEARRRLQVFDGKSSAWSLGPALPSARFASSVGIIGDKLHMAAGWNYNNNASASLDHHDSYDLAGGGYTRLAAIPTARNAAAAGVIGDKLYVAGGRAPGIRHYDGLSMASLEVYDPASGNWTSGPAMPAARASTAGAVLKGKLYVFGGETVYPAVSNAVERFDPASNRWQTLAPMPYAAHGLGAVTVGDAIYVMGGYTRGSDAEGSESKALYRYVPEN